MSTDGPLPFPYCYLKILPSVVFGCAGTGRAPERCYRAALRYASREQRKLEALLRTDRHRAKALKVIIDAMYTDGEIHKDAVIAAVGSKKATFDNLIPRHYQFVGALESSGVRYIPRQCWFILRPENERQRLTREWWLAKLAGQPQDRLETVVQAYAGHPYPGTSWGGYLGGDLYNRIVAVVEWLAAVELLHPSLVTPAVLAEAA
jgi:hypothetical protein